MVAGEIYQVLTLCQGVIHLLTEVQQLPSLGHRGHSVTWVARGHARFELRELGSRVQELNHSAILPLGWG